jgi:hypothetical protein
MSQEVFAIEITGRIRRRLRPRILDATGLYEPGRGQGNVRFPRVTCEACRDKVLVSVSSSICYSGYVIDLERYFWCSSAAIATREIITLQDFEPRLWRDGDAGKP